LATGLAGVSAYQDIQWHEDGDAPDEVTAEHIRHRLGGQTPNPIILAAGLNQPGNTGMDARQQRNASRVLDFVQDGSWPAGQALTWGELAGT
jgi:hypothetical protein